MKFIIPQNLDLETLIQKQETITIHRRVNIGNLKQYQFADTKTKSLLKHLDYCYFLTHLIIKRRERSESKYVALSTEILDKYIPKPTRIQVVSLLTVLEVIKVNNYYNFDEGKCKSYAIDDKYVGTGFKVIVSKSKFATKIDKVYSKKTDDLLVSPHYPEYNFQQDRILNINFDSVDAMIYANKKFDNGEYTKEQYHYIMNKIESIGAGHHDINLNNKVNRFFSTITNLNSDFRQFIKDSNGDDLISIDFKSSHTFHLLSMIINKKVPTYIITDKEGGICPNVGTFLEEGKRMLCLAQTTGIYEYIMLEYEQAFRESIDREKAKEIFINRFLYGQYSNQKISVWVKSLFPEVSRFITSIGNEALSTELMKSESKLLNNIIIRRIATELPKAIVFGIFDSLLVDQLHFDEVYNIIIEESKAYFGFDTMLHVPSIQGCHAGTGSPFL